MNDIASRGSLLGSLSADQVDILIQEENLKKLGYKFYFAIDSDDLKNYAYPLGIDGNRINADTTYEYITDEQIAMFSLINKKSFKAFLFDEHFEELAQLINTIKILDSKGKKVIDTVSLLIKKLNELTGKELYEIRSELELIKQNISLILSIAVGLQADGVEKIINLRKQGKILFKEQELKDLLIDSSVIKEIFLDEVHPDNNFINYLYSFLKQDIDEENSASSVRKNVSYYRDCRVIGKIFFLNKLFNSLKIKVIILYISSDSKTQNLFYGKTSDFSEPYSYLYNNSISVEDKKINYHRNSAQIFLRLLCEESTPENIISNLDQVNKIFLLKEKGATTIFETNQSVSIENSNLDIVLSNRLEVLRKEFEDYSTLIRIDKFKMLSQSVKAGEKSDNDLNEIPKILEMILNEHSEKTTLNEWRNVVEAKLAEISQLNVFRNITFDKLDKYIKKSMQSDILQALDSGEDFVFGIDHHLPTYFDQENESSDPSFNKIVDHYYDNTEKLKHFIIEFASKLFGSTQYVDELIIKRCILMLMLSNSKLYGKNIIQYLKDFLLSYEFSQSDQASNFYYLQVWILRRGGDYKTAVDVSNEAIKDNLLDPRFYHSLCLNYYCLFEDLKVKKISLLQLALKNLEIALKYYFLRLDAKQVPYSAKKFIDQNINALLNTKSYLLCLGYSFDKNQFKNIAIDDARNTLIELKKRDPKYYKKPEFLHTESFLELQEFYLEEDKRKLNFALEAINLALRIEKMPIKLKEMCIRLRDDIYNILVHK